MEKTVKSASVIIPVWNGRHHLPACLDALLEQDYPDFGIVAVDNGSTDGSADLVATAYPQVQLVRNLSNLGFAGGCNTGLRVAQADILVLLNQDTIVQPGWLRALVAPFADEQVGIVGAKLLGPDGRTLSHAGGYLEWPAVLGRHFGVGEIDQGQFEATSDREYVTGASLATRRLVLDEIGLLDERFHPAYFEDLDLCWRARKADWRVVYTPQAVAIHHEGSSTRHHWPSKHYFHYQSRLLFLFKHFTLPQILNDFVPAERDRISTLPPEELRAGRVALTEIIAMWSLVTREMAEAGATANELGALLGIFQAMREQIVHRLGGDPILQMPRPPTEQDTDANGDGTTLRRPTTPYVDELGTLWEIKEHSFASNIPVLGRLIVAFRNLWNSVATKWYVRPLLSQQVKFNGAVVRALAALFPQAWDSDTLLTLLAERQDDVSRRIAELEARLARLETQPRGDEETLDE